MEREKDDPNNNINNDNNNVLTVMRSKDDDKLFAKEPVISLLPQKQEYGDFLETFETPNAPEKIEKIEFAKMSVGAREIEQAFNKDFQINRFNVYGRTVLLKKIPNCYRNETKLFNYIESLGLGKVESITVNRNYERLQKLVKERKNVVEKLETLYLKLAKQLLILVRLGFIFKAVCDEKNEVCAKNADGADGKENNCVSHISLPIQEPKNHENATIAASKDYRKAQEELYIADETCGFNNIDEPNSYFVSNNFDNELRNQTRNDKKKLVDQLPETERLKQSLILLGWFLANEGTTAGRPGVKAVLKKYPYLVWDALLVLMENMYYYFTELKKDFKGAVEEVGLYQDPILCGEEPNSFNEDEQKHRIAIKERIRRIIGKDIRKQELDKEIFGNKGELQANDSENDELYILFYFFEYYGGNLRNNSLKHWDDIKNIREKLKRCDNEIKELRIEALKERVQSRDASETNLMHATESYNGKVQKSRWIYNVLFCRLVAKKKIDKSWLNSTDSAFVTFKSSTAAQIATQVLVSSGIKELTSEEAPKPNDVLWPARVQLVYILGWQSAVTVGKSLAIVIAAVFYFGIGLLVYKQQFAYAYVESSGSVDMSSDLRNGISAHGDSLAGGRLWIHILHFASVGMITAVVVFSMMMIFKRSFVQAGLALPLLVIIIVFMKHLDRHWIPRIKLLPLEVIRGNETGIARKALENRILDKKIKHRSKTLMNFVSSKTLLSRKEHSKLFSRNKTTTSKLNLVSENPTKQLAHKNSTFEQCTCRRISGNSNIMGKYLQNIFHRTRKMLLHDENSLLVMNNACSSDKCRINRRTGFTKSEDCLPEQKKKYSNYNPKRCLLKKRANKRRPLSVCSVDLRNDVPFPKSKAEACDIINEIVAVTCSACDNSQYICDFHQNSQKLTKISPILSGFKVDMFKSNSKAPSVPKSTFNTDAGKEQLNTSENTKILDRGFPLDDKITYNSYLYPSNYENDDNNHSNDSNDVRYNLKKYFTISHKSDYEVQDLKRIGDISNLELPVPIEDPNSVKICDSNQNPSSDFNKNVIPKNNFVITNRNGISNFQKLYTEKSTAEENKFVSSYKHDLEKAAQCSDVGENRGIIKACSRIFGSAIYRPSLNGNSQHEKKHIWKSMSIDERYKITSKGFSKNNNANDFGSYYQSTDNIYAVLQKFTRKDEVGAQKAKGYQFMNVKSDILDIKERVGAKNTNFNSQISIGGRGLGLMENSKKPADRRRLRNKRLNIFNCDCLPEEVEEGINIPQGFGDIMEEYTGEINFENNTEGSDSSTNSDDDLAREILIRDFDFSSNINPFSNLGKNICSDTNSDINYNSDAHEYPSGISDRLHEQDGYKGVRNSEFPNDLKINKRSHTSKQNRNSNKIKSRSEKDMNTSKAKNKHCRSCSRKVITNYDEAAHYQYLNPCLWEPLRTVLWLPQNPLRMTSDHLKCILYEFQ
ncbi:hypothetical protein AX774_g455 [Zancudomyces culisetae]|uniref:CSC1/OSCA1-like cytosolic domain-containing protein n=1 Tax=Zancudomyces culisetae TaxID=1213189 RepID=A0A1R1PYH0_ZANCU|nr:hypothetical protein AX774_g455 [Zancudomyces culisetae]|eukprot:OMH85991.1 hypothetical protein AX774_g455 [Zancudomyces culisetae]